MGNDALEKFQRRMRACTNQAREACRKSDAAFREGREDAGRLYQTVAIEYADKAEFWKKQLKSLKKRLR